MQQMKPLGRQPNSCKQRICYYFCALVVIAVSYFSTCGCRMAAKMKQKATKKKERAVGDEGPSSTMDIMIPTSTAIMSNAQRTLSSWAACIGLENGRVVIYADLERWNDLGLYVLTRNQHIHGLKQLQFFFSRTQQSQAKLFSKRRNIFHHHVSIVICALLCESQEDFINNTFYLI